MKSIVIVDNEDDLRYTLKTILTRRGYIVHDDATGEIIERREIERSDLILLDIDLDKKDGRDICLELKQRPATNIFWSIVNHNCAEISSLIVFK